MTQSAIGRVVVDMCRRRAGTGWASLIFDVTGGAIDLSVLAPDDLTREVEVDRTVPGFDDLAPRARRLIEPGDPAASVLYHVAASPRVAPASDTAPAAFDLAELVRIEDLVYAERRVTLGDLVGDAPDEFAVVTFALEYRDALRTPHRRHADLCCSRTGVARVGTAPAEYDASARSWVTRVDGDPFAFRVRPARFAPFLARRRRGHPGAAIDRKQPGDDDRWFWEPVHKLFDGPECLVDLDLAVSWRSRHRNDKIARLHRYLEAQGYDVGLDAADLTSFPFSFEHDLADWSDDPADPPGVMAPTIHDRLVEPAQLDGRPVTLHLPAELDSTKPHTEILARYFSGLELNPVGLLPTMSPDQTLQPSGRSHPAPEIVNVRREVLSDGTIVNLNDHPDVAGVVAAGNYDALHFVDFAADGLAEATVAQVDLPQLAAYSVVAPPDFFPSVRQLDLMEWWHSLPDGVAEGLWAVLPRALCDIRLPAAMLPAGDGDETVTAIVTTSDATAHGDGAERAVGAWADDLERQSTLPDAAAGVFDPGWDVTTDSVDHRLSFVGYGLGTPYVEDVKICAALGTYWPAVAPDATRTFQPDPYWPTVCPLTDEEIGIVGELPWDGFRGPRLVDTSDGPMVEYLDIDDADAVTVALERRLTAELTARVRAPEYVERILAMAAVYRALGLHLPDDPTMSEFERMQTFLRAKATWSVVSYRRVDGADADLVAACSDADAAAPVGGERWWGGWLNRHGADRDAPDFQHRWLEILERVDFYVRGSVVVLRRDGGRWSAREVRPT